jgi:hypothetical protein
MEDTTVSLSPNQDVFYAINIEDDEYAKLFNDLVRMFTVHFIMQWMYFCRDPSQFRLLDETFFELLFYILLGVCFYWLIVRKIIVFKYHA